MIARTELSRTVIVDRALDIADDEGIAAITIRRLAHEFGVTPMALYWHFKNKEELLGAMGDRFFDGVEYPTAGRWDAKLRAVVTMLIESLKRHPGAAHLAPPRILVCEAGRLLAEDTLSDLRRLGFTTKQATDIGRIAMQTAAMLVIEEAGAEVGVPADQRAEVIEAKRRAIASLPRDRFPSLVDCADVMTETEDPDAYYRFGVDLFINGVQKLQAALARS